MQSKIWFTADIHLSHISILRFRPKRREAAGITLQELENGNKEEVLQKYDKWLIEKWNNTIKKQDIVYILGDLCLGNREQTERLLNRLNGKKYLIIGNHDKSCRGLENYFVWTGSIKEAKFNHEQFPFIRPDETFCVEMCHYPLMAWNRKPHGSVHICGHIHGAHDNLNKETGALRVDVGLDSEIAELGFVSLEKLYSHFRNIVEANGFDTFKDYAEFLMEKQGFRD